MTTNKLPQHILDNMTPSAQTDMLRLWDLIQTVSPRVFVNRKDELIVVPSQNIFFKLSDVVTPTQLQAKVIAWLSRPTHKGAPPYWQKRLLSVFNDFLGTAFTKDEMSRIYTYLGNDVNRQLTIQFIDSGFDLDVLPDDYHGA